MAISYKETMRVEEFTSQYIMNPFYKQFGVTPKVADYNTADGRSKQINDIDCEINGWKIQEKSGKVMNNTILLEVYNDILAQSDEGLYGWGVTSDANYHLFGYRGGPEKELYEGKVYVARVNSQGIRSICRDLIKNDEFPNILNYIRSLINKNEPFNNYFDYNLTILDKVIKVRLLVNSSRKKNSRDLKYALSIIISTDDFKSFGKGHDYRLYKLDNENKYQLCN